MSRRDFLEGNTVRLSSPITALDDNLSTKFSAFIVNIRKGSNKIANASSNCDQMSELSENKANKAYLDKNLNKNLTFDSNIKSDSNTFLFSWYKPSLPKVR